MTRHVDKVIFVNNGALNAKYGAEGRRRITEALAAAVEADAAREMSTRVIALDRGATMSAFGIDPVGSPDDAAATKAAVDAVATATTAHYLVLLGAPDVIAQQQLANPTGDEDPTIPSDLPYACVGAAADDDPARFVGAARVVGRLPDLLGESNPTALIRSIRAAARWRPCPAADYASVFALSTETWKVSTELSVQQLGCSGPVRVSPPGGPRWTERQLAPRVHFVNCHGADTDASWYGEREGEPLPVSMTSAWLKGRVQKGTVVAAECCYGAQHYLPSLEANGDPGMAVSYLRSGAIGVVGSSTIAYGPPDEMGDADLLTRYFLSAVLEGASLGRALLVARQRFVQSSGELDPISLKTLAQFDLVGDPSVQVVRRSAVPHARKSARRGESQVADGEVADRVVTAARRRALAGVGIALDAVVPRTSAVPIATGRARAQSLATALGQPIPAGASVRSYGMAALPVADDDDGRDAGRAGRAAATRFHLVADGGSVMVIRDEPGRPPSARTVLRKSNPRHGGG